MEQGERSQPNNEIWYTSTDGELVTPYNLNVFGASLISNSYSSEIGVLEFDNNVTAIGNNAFQYCSTLKSIVIPNSVLSIGDLAFGQCSSLASINIPSSILPQRLGYLSFQGCRAFPTIDNVRYADTIALGFANDSTPCVLKEGTRWIGDWSFYNYYAESLTLPKSFQRLGAYSLRNTVNLSNLIIHSEQPPQNGGSAFLSSKIGQDGTAIFVPAQSVQLYKTQWSQYANIIQAITE